MKILIVKLSAIGDVIHTLPALDLLHKKIPDGSITWVVEEKAAGIVLGHPHLHKVIVSKRKQWLKNLSRPAGWLTTLREVITFTREPRQETYDLVIDFQGLLRCAETLFFDYYRQHNLKIKVARIFNTYGPHMHPNDGRVVSNFIMQALQNKPITIYGNGQQTRSFCYVDDLIEAFVRLMNTADDVIGPINLGNPVEFTIKQVGGKSDRFDKFEIIN